MSLSSCISKVRFPNLRLIPQCVGGTRGKQGASVLCKSLQMLLAFGRRRLEHHSREEGAGRAMDETVGEAETSYEHTVPGDRRGQAICLVVPLGQGFMVSLIGLFSAGSVTGGLCAVSSCTLDDTGEREGRTVAVEMWTAKWVGGRFHLPSRKGKIFSFPGNYLLFRLRAIKYNSPAFRRRRF